MSAIRRRGSVLATLIGCFLSISFAPAQTSHGVTGVTGGVKATAGVVTGVTAHGPGAPAPGTIEASPDLASDGVLTLGQLARQLAGQHLETPATACPQGYIRAAGVAGSQHVTCLLKKQERNVCATMPGAYACGRNASECCGGRSNNSCFAGSYACAVPGSTPGQTLKACCMTN
jgi:hypothetical protein